MMVMMNSVQALTIATRLALLPWPNPRVSQSRWPGPRTQETSVLQVLRLPTRLRNQKRKDGRHAQYSVIAMSPTSDWVMRISWTYSSLFVFSVLLYKSCWWPVSLSLDLPIFMKIRDSSSCWFELRFLTVFNFSYLIRWKLLALLSLSWKHVYLVEFCAFVFTPYLLFLKIFLSVRFYEF